MWWKGQHILSHGTNLSAGVALLFSPERKVSIEKTEEFIKGRLVLVKTIIEGMTLYFINVYAPNVGHERLQFFSILTNVLRQDFSDGDIIIGGDWNCTECFNVDRNNVEPHMLSSTYLSRLVKDAELLDMWRIKHPFDKQYTWVKILDNRVSAARLDRIYVSKKCNNRVVDCCISPIGFSDHHLIFISVNMEQFPRKSSYWHFNAKLLQDAAFSEYFVAFWNYWREKKNYFENLKQWWEVGKTQIKLCCQQFTAYCTTTQRETIKALERDIESIETEILRRNDPAFIDNLQQKKKQLSYHLNERVKAALVRSRFTSVTDMDAPSAYFFQLERSVAQYKQMTCLRLPDGKITNDITEMRRHAVDFYSSLYKADHCNSVCEAQLFHELPQMDSTSRTCFGYANYFSRTYYCCWTVKAWSLSWYWWFDFWILQAFLEIYWNGPLWSFLWKL